MTKVKIKPRSYSATRNQDVISEAENIISSIKHSMVGDNITIELEDNSVEILERVIDIAREKEKEEKSEIDWY